MKVVTDGATAILLGGILAAGVLSVLAALPRWRAQGLMARIAPHLRGVYPDSTMPPSALPDSGVLPMQMTGILRRLQRSLGSLLGGDDAIARRLAQAGLEPDVSRFRAQQLGWGIGGFALGGATLVIAALLGRMSAPVALLPIIGGAGAIMVCDAVLTARARSRTQRVAEELPTVLEFLALCLSAGEGLLDTLTRVGAVGSGELSRELQKVVLRVRTGSPLGDALSALSAQLQLPALSRAVDQVVSALERGAPLAGVLQAQATDAREDAKRALIEQAGKKEISMMLPLVFLILPLSVVFAVFPGVLILRLGLG